MTPARTDAATAAINKSHGQVATTSVLFIFFAVAFGFFLKYVDIYKKFGAKGGTAVNTAIAIVSFSSSAFKSIFLIISYILFAITHPCA